MPSVKLEDVELAYEESGQGPPVLFVQGVGLAGRAWAPQIAELARDQRCIALDNGGIGGSRGDTRNLTSHRCSRGTRSASSAAPDLTVERLARDALGLLDALHIERAHLVGHSLGGVIVQQLALLAPERVASLALLCTFSGGRDLRSPSARLLWLGTLSRLGPRASRRRAFARLIMPDAYLEARGAQRVMSELEAIFGRPLWQSPGIADAQLQALRAHDQSARLPELAAHRCIVLSGKQDPIATHASNTALARSLRAPHHVWEDASHALPIQHAAEVNAVLRAHFAAK